MASRSVMAAASSSLAPDRLRASSAMAGVVARFFVVDIDAVLLCCVSISVLAPYRVLTMSMSLSATKNSVSPMTISSPGAMLSTAAIGVPLRYVPFWLRRSSICARSTTPSVGSIRQCSRETLASTNCMSAESPRPKIILPNSGIRRPCLGPKSAKSTSTAAKFSN